ncbi:TonB-dependent receptor [Pseudoalteromonas luteoviolacea B = ATCC 29581]|nr:TonB-dependent receptor [Pseudoalteromonas luteoviolacea B = ATCC 29581]
MYNKITLAMLMALGANAQANTTETQTTLEKIEITGSRIKGVDLEGTQPITVIGAEEIARSGANSVYELMQTLSQVKGGSGTFSASESGSTSTSTPAGQSAASLRGMGPSATLTLINGRRVAPSSFAAGTQNFVDINSIPLAAIERVEVLATGASAIYGADAVAGVINYILKEDFEGLEFDATYGDSVASTDEGVIQINAIYGMALGEGNLTVFADAFKRNQFNASDRAATRSPLLVNGYSYLPKLENTPNIYYYSAKDGNELPAPGCKTALVTTEYGESICGYYGNEDDVLAPPFESLSSGFMFSQNRGEHTFKSDFFYSKTKSKAFSSPAAINQIDDSEGPFVREDALFIFDDATGGNALLDSIYSDPFDSYLGRELWGFGFDARFNAPRTIEVESDNVRLVVGLEGYLGEWFYDSGLTYSQSKSSQKAIAGVYNRYKFHAALSGELCSDGQIASLDGNDLVCSTGQVLPFYNPFLVGNAANDATLALTQAMPTREGKSKVIGADFNVSGELIQIGDVSIQAALGIEARRETLSDIPSNDAVASAENAYLVDVFGFGSSIADATRNQYGAFAEFYIPLTEKLEMQLAGRLDHYDDFGSTFNPKVSASYRASDSLLLRAGAATSFRAPSLTQAGVKLRTTTSTFDCGANQAVADLYCEGDGTLVTVNSLELGNPELNAEESESLSFGIAWSPTKSTNLTLDYWQFDYTEVIDTNMTAVLDRAITDSTLRHCGLVPTGAMGVSFGEDVCSVRDASGLRIDEAGADLRSILTNYISEFDPRRQSLQLYRDHVIGLENTGTQTIKGIDLKFDHGWQLAQSEVSVTFDMTHYIQYDRNKPGSDQIESLVGSFRYPQNIARLSVSLDRERYYVNAFVDYTDSYEDDIEGLRGREIDELNELGLLDENDTRQVQSWTTLGLRAGYEFNENTLLTLSINNVLDKAPPKVYGSSRGFDSINHSALGANYRLGLNYRF